MNSYINLNSELCTLNSHPTEGGAAVQVEILLKIAGVGVLVTAICQVLTRAGREELATLATVAGILLVLLTVVELAGQVLSQVQAVFGLP